MTAPVDLSAEETALLRREMTAANTFLSAARKSHDPLRTLSSLTAAVETLTSTQHELVNVLLDRGASWSMLAEALSTSSTGAQRRYPRRATRRAVESDAGT